MTVRGCWWLVLVVLLGVEIGLGMMGSARPLFVKAQYETIQEAVDAAAWGDVVCVEPGLFDEPVVLKEGVGLLGSGPELTRIDAQDNAVAIVAADGCRISGLKIKNGIVGIDCIGSYVEISNCSIETKYLGIRAIDASPVISNTTIDAVYVGVLSKGAGAPELFFNDLSGRYVGVWAENTSPFLHNNRIADYENGIYLIHSNAIIINNEVINSLYDGIVLTRGSGCSVINNTVVGNMQRGVSIFGSSPGVFNNIVTENETGIYCQDSQPALGYNCVGGNRSSAYEGAQPEPTDILEEPLLMGIGTVSYVRGARDNILVCEDAHWVEGWLVGLDLVPNTAAMCLEYGGQNRVYRVVDNTRTTIEADSSLLEREGSSEEPYTSPGDTFFVDDIRFQEVAAGWPADSPCIDAGDPHPMFSDPDGSRNDIGALGGPYAGSIGVQRAPLVDLRASKQVYRGSETVHVTARLSNDQPGYVEADLYIVAFVGDSPTFYSYPNWTDTFCPVRYSFEASQSETITVIEMPASSLPSSYFRLLAAFTKPGTFELVSPVDELWFEVQSG